MSAERAREVAPGLRAEEVDGVHTWWLCNEARRNAVSPGALQWMAERAAELHGAIVVLRGAGERAFCAGFDLTALAEVLDHDPTRLPDDSLITATTALRRADATLVAAIHGHAIGAGVELACACDLRVASRDASFSVPAAELGVVYHAEGLGNMREVFGPTGVRRLLMLGDRISAEEAWSAGALVRLCEPGALDRALDDVLARLHRAAPLSLRGSRDLLRALDQGPLAAPIREEHERRRHEAYRSDDHHEARQARLERRPPRFRGR